MTLDISPEDRENDYCFEIKLAKNESHESRIILDSRKGTVKLDRTKSGVRFSSLSTREFSIGAFKDIKLRIVFDKYALEVFVNDGRHAAAMKIDTPLEASGITFGSDIPVFMDVVKNDFIGI